MKQSAAVSVVLIILTFALAFIGIPRVTQNISELGYTVPQAGETDSSVTVNAKIDGEVRSMNMDEYLQGVLRAEMPAAFEIEALKAQAVAARTETYYKIENGPPANHPDADICNDINCCQAWISEEKADSNWGENAEKYSAKIATAVRETDGMTIIYDNAPIFAAFFSAAAGSTQDSGEVWVKSLPYLQSVKSPEGEDQVPNYYSTASVDADTFKTTILAHYPEADLSGGAQSWLGSTDVSSTGLVRRITVGGTEISGGKMRTMFSLRSACFTLKYSNGDFVFSVTGYGHGVGMSQYGANTLAQQGKNYREILAWYYTGVKIQKYVPDLSHLQSGSETNKIEK